MIYGVIANITNDYCENSGFDEVLGYTENDDVTSFFVKAYKELEAQGVEVDLYPDKNTLVFTLVNQEVKMLGLTFCTVNAFPATCGIKIYLKELPRI